MPAPVQPGRLRRSWFERVVLAIGSAVVVTALAGAVVVVYGYWKVGQIPVVDVSLVEPASGEPQNYLIVGSDTRATLEEDAADAEEFTGENGEDPNPSGSRADSIVIARVDPEGEHIDMLSVPRDLWIIPPGSEDHDRINATYAVGRQHLIDTIQEVFEIPIHHYIELDFVGFRRVVDAIGGIPMYFDTAMRDFNSGLQVNGDGCVLLDGEQALALARSRHLQYQDGEAWVDDPTGDHGRIQRQQVLVLKAVERVVALDLTSPSRLNRVIDASIDHVNLDPDIDFDDIAGLIERFQEINDETLTTYGLPVEGYRTSGGASVLRLHEAEAEPILDTFREEPASEADEAPAQGDPAAVSVEVLNGSGTQGQASAAGEALTYVGFQVTGTANAEGLPGPTTEIHHGPGGEAGAQFLERHLSAGADIVEDPELGEGQLQLITGADFTTVMQAPRPADEGDPPAPPAAPTTTVDEDGDEESGPATTVVGRTTGEEPEGITCH